MGVNERATPVEVPYIDSMIAELSRSSPPFDERFLHLGDFGDERPTQVSASVFRDAQARLLDRALSCLGEIDGKHLLDVGCGFGATVALLQRRMTRGRLVGLDIGARQLDLARQQPVRSGLEIGWELADATSMPFERASFDGVIAIECAFHFASRRRFAHEAARVLKPGGSLVLTDIVGATQGPQSDADAVIPPGLLDALTHDLAPYPDPWCDDGDWASCARDAGLRVNAVHDLTEATLPSFAFIFAGKTPDFLSDVHANDRGAAALAWLMSRRWLRLELWSFSLP